MPTDTSEAGLETLIARSLVEDSGYLQGQASDYDRARCVDPIHLLAFLEVTQPTTLERLQAIYGPSWREKLLDRVANQVKARGIIDVLRKGIKIDQEELALYYRRPATTRNPGAAQRFRANRFVVTRQLRYSQDQTRRALDLALFVNGLPLATFELKNRLTKQNVRDAIEQYQRDRDPREPLFQLGRCLVHFAVDDDLVYMTTELRGERTTFLPFNRGYKEGAGNPPNPDGLKTDYLWRQVLTRESLAEIVERYAQMIEEKDDQGRKRHKLIFPRYHQLDLVRRLTADARARGAGRRYLAQHSAGSGKSNSISWLAHQLIELTDEDHGRILFDTVIVVTDRRVLDQQIRDNIRQFTHVAGVVEAVTEGSRQLRDALLDGKRIIITTIQKFPHIVNDIRALGDRRFAIIIDEAHSSQTGENASKMNATLGASGTPPRVGEGLGGEVRGGQGERSDEEPTIEDRINDIIGKQRMLANASYFAFTATPKSRTLELFGQRDPETGQYRPFHTYSMKQAIEEEFILDVLQNYTTYQSYYKLVQATEDDPEFDTARAQKKLHRYVEQHPAAITAKARIIVDHFMDEVWTKRKIDGRAKAMVVTSSVANAIEYKHKIDAELARRGRPFKALVAFSGQREIGGVTYDEERMNGFPSNDIPDEFKKDEYRILIVAEKFQTGFDQPLLHTMYVDKPLSDVKAVQTLSRLNRAYKPWKNDTFVLDFANTADQIRDAFEPFYRATILSEGTDINRLNDLQDELDRAQVYQPADVEELMALYLGDAARDRLDPILDRCADAYQGLDTDAQIAFKTAAKNFVRAYQFLVLIRGITKTYWESLKTFLKLLLPKLPAPTDEDLAQGILEATNLESYRAEQRETRDIILTGGEPLAPTPAEPRQAAYEPTLDHLSAIIRDFNERYGTEWTESDLVQHILFTELPNEIRKDPEFQNAKRNSDRQNARITHDNKVDKTMQRFITTHTQLYKEFADNESFRQWLYDTLFDLDYNHPDTPPTE